MIAWKIGAKWGQHAVRIKDLPEATASLAGVPDVYVTPIRSGLRDRLARVDPRRAHFEITALGHGNDRRGKLAWTMVHALPYRGHYAANMPPRAGPFMMMSAMVPIPTGQTPMTKLARLTLTTALMGSLVLPALAQSGATSGVPMQPTVKAVPGLHHRAARNPNHVHHIADTVRTPAVTSGSIPAAPATVPSKGPAVNGNTAMTSPAPAVGNSMSVQGKDTMVDSKASATPVAPAAKPSVAAVSPSVAAPPAPALSAAPHAAGTTASPALPRVQ